MAFIEAVWIIVGGVLLIGLLLLGWVWFHLFSVWGYTPPTDLLPIDVAVEHQVFVFGTLRNPLIRRHIIRRHVPGKPARLPGYLRVGLDIQPQDGAYTSGYLLVVSADELHRLDRYERLGIRYERVRMELESGTTAWVYRRIPGQTST